MAYSLASNVVCMAWVCPYCGHDGLGTCAAGFNLLSSRCFQPVLGRSFGQEFRRKSWVLYPGWFLPPLVGLFLMITAFSRFAPALLVVFCVDAFWLLLQFSKSHCETCETVDCPRYPKSRKVVQAD